LVHPEVGGGKGNGRERRSNYKGDLLRHSKKNLTRSKTEKRVLRTKKENSRNNWKTSGETRRNESFCMPNYNSNGKGEKRRWQGGKRLM